MGVQRECEQDGQGFEVTGAMRLSEPAARPAAPGAARKRAAVEIVARHEPALRQTARRYSLCAEDAEDAYQRALEILLTKAPSDRPRELIRWTQTVTKHEALAIRRNRERLLGPAPPPASGEETGEDWIALIPAGGGGPGEATERREKIARSREALRALKPAELRALTLLAEGYSYAEIGAITGFSRTKVNRCLAEGRERFRRLLSRSEEGGRCAEIGPLLSAFCDGEASAAQEAAVREHLRACGACRATMRAYRATPSAAAALAPALPLSRSLLERAQEALAALHARLPGGGGAAGSTAAQLATGGGARGAGVATLAKLLAVCAGTAGGAAACVATGVAPAPLDLAPHDPEPPAIERPAPAPTATPPSGAALPEPAPPPEPAPQAPREPVSSDRPPPPAEAGAVEYTAPPAAPAPPQPASQPSSGSSGSPAGEFGP